MPAWWPLDCADSLEPVDELMVPLIEPNGAVNDTVTYLGRAHDRWLAVPATIGSQIKGPCSRTDLMKKHAGVDVQAIYPVGEPPKPVLSPGRSGVGLLPTTSGRCRAGVP